MRSKDHGYSGAKRTAYGWICVFLLIWLPLAGTVTANNFLFLNMSLLIGFVILSMILGKKNLSGVNVIRSFQNEIFAETPFEVTYKIYPPKAGSGARDLFITEDGPMEITSGPTHISRIGEEELEATSLAELPARGLVEIPGPLVSSTFPFGLARRSQRVGPPQSLIVFPKVRPMDHEAQLQFGDPGSKVEKRSVIGAIPYNFREYAPGDSYKHVQWKITAKTGKLHVAEYTDEAAGQVNVRVGENPGEEALSTAASLVYHFCSEGVPVALEGPRFRMGPDSGGAFARDLLTALALWESRPIVDYPAGDQRAHMTIDIDQKGEVRWDFMGRRGNDAA